MLDLIDGKFALVEFGKDGVLTIGEYNAGVRGAVGFVGDVGDAPGAVEVG